MASLDLKFYLLIIGFLCIELVSSEQDSVLKPNEFPFVDQNGTTVYTIFSKSDHHTFTELVTYPKIPCTKVSSDYNTCLLRCSLISNVNFRELKFQYPEEVRLTFILTVIVMSPLIWY